jgi:hypothetical protein
MVGLQKRYGEHIMKKVGPKAPTFAETLPERGYMILYRPDQVNHCPGCGGTQWHVGRTGAECAYESCALALDFAESSSGSGTTQSKNLHIPEKRGMTGEGVIFRKDFHQPTRRTLQDDFYADA